jgi:hypothetical protein
MPDSVNSRMVCAVHITAGQIAVTIQQHVKKYIVGSLFNLPLHFVVYNTILFCVELHILSFHLL